MKRKKILTLEQLVDFCKQNKLYSFNSKDTGYELAVSIPGQLTFDEDLSKGLLYTEVKVCHTLLNRNGSYISEENMKKALPSLVNRPLLAYIHQLDDGSYDFHAHDIEIVEDEDGNSEAVYLEKQIGSFTSKEPYLEYDESNDKTYVMAEAAIPEEYTRACDIIRRKEGTKVSCELVIEKFSYNAKEKYLDLEDFYFSGCTCLGSEKDGEEIGEGMIGSRLDIKDFSVSNNSMFTSETARKDDELINTLEKLNTTLSGFNTIDKRKEETQMKMEENTTVIEQSKDEFIKNFTVKFEISHDEIRYALYNLIEQFDELDNDWYYIRKVYDDHFVMEGWSSGLIYGCGYKKDNDNVSLEGERYRLFSELLTESEKNELDNMRSNYSTLLNKVDTYEKAKLDAKKDEIFQDETYAEYLESDEFKSLIEDKDNYTVEELKDKAEIAFAKCVKKSGSFILSKNTNKNFVRKNLASKTQEVEKKNAYGSLFNDK